MKNLKLLFYGVLISLVTLTSCTNNDDVNVPDPQESATMQTTLENLRTLYNENGEAIDEMNPTGNQLFDFCFEFVYPIELIYNNGSTVTVNSLEELIEVLINSTDNLYIVGIEFPFDVEIYNPNTNEVEILTITNEEEFAALLESCDFGDSCDCTDEYEPVCVEIEENGQTIIITFPNACYAECEGFTEDQYFDCDENDDCDISELEIEVGECTSQNTYTLTINFEYENTNQDLFNLNVRDSLIGYYALSELPLVIENFELSGYENDYIKVCINDNLDCCEEIEWDAPDCVIIVEPCDISELEIEVGECTSENTYTLTLDFEYENTDQEFFNLYVRDSLLIGYYPLLELPLTIENFELSGFDNDYMKISINDNLDCSEEIEWEAPDCDNDGGDCNISNLEVEVGECNPAGTYVLTIDFDYENTGDQQFFDLYVRNGEFIGYYELADLPLTIENFELSGYDDDYIKVCINDTEDCCAEIEWEAPDCNGDGDDCYEYVFPITMFQGGEAIEVNSNEEVDEYLALGWDLQYPIDIIVNNEIITVMQGILEGAYGERCD